MENLLVFLAVIAGAAISVVSGALWQKYKSFHLLPWVYAFFICLFPAVSKGRGILYAAFFGGLIFYGMAWASTLRNKQRTKNPDK